MIRGVVMKKYRYGSHWDIYRIDWHKDTLYKAKLVGAILKLGEEFGISADDFAKFHNSGNHNSHRPESFNYGPKRESHRRKYSASQLKERMPQEVLDVLPHMNGGSGVDSMDTSDGLSNAHDIDTIINSGGKAPLLNDDYGSMYVGHKAYEQSPRVEDELQALINAGIAGVNLEPE